MDLRCAVCLIYKEGGIHGRPAITLISGTAACIVHVNSLTSPVALTSPVRIAPKPYSATG